jgi:hypothetical protein
MLRQHLSRLEAQGISLRCPVCAFDDFAIQQSESASYFVEGFDSPDGPIMPRLPVICRRCFHVVEFAWLPILKSQQGL